LGNKKNKLHFLAFDLGAESGRAVLGSLDGKRLTLRELSRFSNGALEIHGHLHWNIYRLYEEIKRGLALCASQCAEMPESIGIDTWGVDFALLDDDGAILGLPYAYRDPMTQGAPEQFYELFPREQVYQLTGIQTLPFNTLFQLFALVRDQKSVLENAGELLFMPDIFNYLLTGEKSTEFTFATTSQLFNPVRREWVEELFLTLGLDREMMQDVVPPGTVLGNLRKAVSEETGLPALPVVATASHDTAAAVAAVPAEGRDFAYISSGTWSLLGVETAEPVVTDLAMSLNFTNEGGVGFTNRLLKNIMGLWLVQECRRAWAKDRDYSYAELTDAASSAPPFGALIDPDWPGFLNPPDMPEAIAQFCRLTGQKPPTSHGGIIRTALEGLALKYRLVLEQLGRLCSHPIRRLHIIGGGSQNRLLCRFTADAAGLPVLAGPVEATAAGNLLVQALALGRVSGLDEIREIVRCSFAPQKYEPEDQEPWNRAYERFREIRPAP
jgi:rhamnulokinase